MRRSDLTDLVARARHGEQLAVARLISLVEEGGPELPEVSGALGPTTGRAHVVGITGPPGVGKSTTTSELVRVLRAQRRRVGVLAVDPSSPFSGGALLGDRVRMSEHATDDGVFIRSMATRGHLGGLARATPHALRVLDAAGCDVVLIETVGVGQSEIDVVALADSTVVLLAPGAGDGVQAAKAGVLEVADVFAVNKADRDGADLTVRDLRRLVSLGLGDPGGCGEAGTAVAGWRVPVLRTVASRGDGVAELVTALDDHLRWLDSSGERERRRLARTGAEIQAIALERNRLRLDEIRGAGGLPELARRVLAGELDPYRAADELTSRIGRS